MKPITNILLLLALVCYVFLPLFEISFLGNLSGLNFTASMITENKGIQYTFFALIPFITIFLAIGFNCLKNRYWGVMVTVLIFFAIYFFVNLNTMFQGFSLTHDPQVVPNSEMGEGLPVAGLGIGYYTSFVFTVLALVSALVSMMPFKFNKRLEENIDRRFETGKKQISRVGHGIQGEIHKIGHHHGKQDNATDAPAQEAVPAAPAETIKENVEDDSRFMPKTDEPSIQPADDDSRYMPQHSSEEEKYSDYMPK